MVGGDHRAPIAHVADQLTPQLVGVGVGNLGDRHRAPHHVVDGRQQGGHLLADQAPGVGIDRVRVDDAHRVRDRAVEGAVD